MHEIRVELGEKSYTIFWGEQIWSQCVATLEQFSEEKEVFVLSDTIVAEYYGAKWEALLSARGYRPHFYLLTAGEKAKTWSEAARILEVLLSHNFSRQVPFLALGGGVVGDLGGFVAALYRRGMPFLQIPTTLLAQVDSSVGGKVAVNHPLGKNMIGTFYQPSAVWLDYATLETLPRREWQAGLGEVLKYALLGDLEFFNYLEENAGEILAREKFVLPVLIERCLKVKVALVEEDQFDQGVRSFLNLGHTLGHALEKATDFQKYKHGEAVALGLVLALRLAEKLKMLDPLELQRVLSLMQIWELPLYFPRLILEEVFTALATDKKVRKDKLHFVLPRQIGRVEIKNDLHLETVKATLAEICD